MRDLLLLEKQSQAGNKDKLPGTNRIGIFAGNNKDGVIIQRSADGSERTLPIANDAMSGYYSIAIDTQGDTGAVSELTISAKHHHGEPLVDEDALLRVRVCNNASYANSTNATIAVASLGSTLVETITSTKDIVISPVAGAQATAVLTISGVVLDAQTATVNGRVYYFSSGKTTVTSGAVAADISAGGVKSAGTLTLATQPTAGDTMTIGNKVYTFRATGTADDDGEIGLGANLAATKPLVITAINGTDGVNTAHTQVTAATFSGDTSVITARYTGTHANSYATTETFTAVGNVFDAATLGTTTAGVDVTATQAGAALATAINADTHVDAPFTAASVTGTVTITADAKGVNANAYATTETMTNGAFGAATFTGGINRRLDQFKIALTDATAESVQLRIGPAPIGGKNYMNFNASQVVTHATP